MEQLIFMRRQLHVGVLTQDQTRTLKLKIAEVIDAGNKKLGLELVPREENGDQADYTNAGPVHLYNLVGCRQFMRLIIDQLSKSVSKFTH